MMWPMHGEVQPQKDKLKATNLNTRMPGRVGVQIPLSPKPDFDWTARFDQAISRAFPGPEVPRIYDDHVYLWVDKTNPQPEIEKVYPCIEQANNDYRVLRER